MMSTTNSIPSTALRNYQTRNIAIRTCLLLFSSISHPSIEPVDFRPDIVNVLWSYSSFLQQMEIDALEQLISEGIRTNRA